MTQTHHDRHTDADATQGERIPMTGGLHAEKPTAKGELHHIYEPDPHSATGRYHCGRLTKSAIDKLALVDCEICQKPIHETDPGADDEHGLVAHEACTRGSEADATQGGAKFTPGPWTIGEVNPRSYKDWEDVGGYRIDAPGHEQICYVWNETRRIPLDKPQSEGSLFGTRNGAADARLIAAAPDLFAALQEIAKGEGAYSRDPLTHAANTIESMKALATAALTLATRREPSDANS